MWTGDSRSSERSGGALSAIDQAVGIRHRLAAASLAVFEPGLLRNGANHPGTDIPPTSPTGEPSPKDVIGLTSRRPRTP
jgi:hypothetical protein